MQMIMKNMNPAPVTVFPNPMQQTRELTASELANIAYGKIDVSCSTHNTKPTGNYKYYYVMGVRVYREVEVRCTDCGKTFWYKKIF